MPRRKRKDFPGAWWHVMNRGTSRRAIFEDDQDRRYFLSLLAWMVHWGCIEVHAFCLMDTHYHLLIRSTRGELSEAMHWIGMKYAHWFNRRQGRDGSLCRGRFVSKLIAIIEYRWAVLYYIHRNPTSAGLAETIGEYRWSSAWYLANGVRCPWLSTQFSRRAFRDLAIPVAIPELTERWLRSADSHRPEIGKIVRAGEGSLRAWLRAQAENADGPLPRRVLLLPSTISEEVCHVRREHAYDHRPVLIEGRACPYRIAHAALLYTAGGLAFESVAHHTGVNPSTIRMHVQRHQKLLTECGDYASFVAKILKQCFLHDYPSVTTI